MTPDASGWLPSDKHMAAARVAIGYINTSCDEAREQRAQIVAAALANAERDGLRRGYLAGFNASGEGWNGEYPFQDKGRSPEGSPEWVIKRDRFLSEAGEKA